MLISSSRVAYPVMRKKRVVEVEEAALRRGDKNAFLNVGNQRAIFFLRAFAVGNIFQNVDGAQSAVRSGSAKAEFDARK